MRIIFNHMAACRGHRPLCAFYVHLVCRDCCSLSVHTRSSCPCVGIFQRAPALSGCLCSVQHLAVRSSPQGGSLLACTYGREPWRVSSSESNCRIEDHVRLCSDHTPSCRPGRSRLFAAPSPTQGVLVGVLVLLFPPQGDWFYWRAPETSREGRVL